MKFPNLLLFFGFLLCSTTGFSQTPPLPAADNQIWNDLLIVFPVVKTKDKNGKSFDRLSFFLNGTLRFARGAADRADQRIGFGFEYKINNHVSLLSAYMYRGAEPLKNRREYESRFRFAVNLEKKFRKVALKDRNLVEYRFRNSGINTTRYRNRVQVFFPVTRDKKEIFAPFVGDEIFYDFTVKSFTRNEFSVGISKKFSPQFSADFYYLLQKTRTNVLGKLNVFGMSVKIKID